MYQFFRFMSVMILLVLVAGAGFVAGRIYESPGAASFLPITGMRPTQDPGQGLDIALIEQAYDVIQENYADRATLNETNLTYAAINGMVDALGDTGHSRFLTPDMVNQENQEIEGQFEGIGALMQEKDGLPVILTPLDNSPAQKAGLRAGDIIVRVNDEDMTGLSLTEVISKVKGPAGTKVKITIERPETGEQHTFEIVRARIDLQNVTWQMLPGTNIAHVRISSFSKDVGNDLKKALSDAKSQGAKGLILDLRNNPGGLLNEAVTVVSQFLSTGNVMQEKNAQGEVRDIPVKRGGVATDIPMVVLINEGSASAAEITAGAMQDYGRATLIGQTTFGTGTVLLRFPLDDSSAILLATELWLTPKGRVIWHKGIEPDIAVEMPEEVIPSIPQSERDWTVENLQTTEDAQLKKAIEELSKQIK